MSTSRSVVGLVVLFPLFALAVPTFTSSGGSTGFLEDSAPVPIDPALTLVDPIGPDIAGARVSITSGLVPSEDVLSVTNQSGVTGSYSAASGILTLSGTAPASTFETVLRTVKYQNTQANNPTAGPRQITFSLNSSSLFFPTTGHFYEFVPGSGITWTAAKTAAESRTYFGLQGYLVTVTSAAENAFIQSKLVGKGWMGASASIFTVPRTWSWVTGPEATTNFFTQTTMGAANGGGVPIGGLYSNWAPYEPNTNAGIEQYAHFFSDGTWNDYDDNIGALIQGYVCEYGGMAGDPTPTLSGTKTVQVSACEAGCSVCSSATICTTCDSGLTLSGGDCLGAVPTLSEWGMIIFTAIMAGTAFLSLRRQTSVAA